MKPLLFFINKDGEGKITLTEDELRDLLIQAYEQGINEYKPSIATPNFPISPYEVTYTNLNEVTNS